MLKLMPMNIYDVAAQQARMEDQAARGVVCRLGSRYFLPGGL